MIGWGEFFCGGVWTPLAHDAVISRICVVRMDGVSTFSSQIENFCIDERKSILEA